MSDTNTTFPFRENFQAPEPTDGYQPSRVVSRAINTEGTPTAQSMAILEHAKAEHARLLSALADERSHYSAEGYKAQVAQLAETASAKAVGTALQNVEQRTVSARARVERVRRDISPDGDVAAELRGSRYWDGVVRLLDSADSSKLTQAAQALVAKAQGVELGVLAKELGTYMQSRGSSTEGWLDACIAQVVPELASANAELLQAEKALQVTKYNHDVMQRAFAQGSAAAPFVDPSSFDPDA